MLPRLVYKKLRRVQLVYDTVAFYEKSAGKPFSQMRFGFPK